MAYVNTTFLPKTNGMVFGDRLQARADKGRVYLMADATPAPPPLAVTTDAILTGDPYIGGELVCTPPVVTGGIEPYGYDYTWLESSIKSTSNVTPILEFDKGKNVQCYVSVISADGQTVTSTSNSIGPITYIPADVTLTQTLDSSTTVTPFTRITLQVQAAGNHDISYGWQFRNAADDGWVNATVANLASEFPAATTEIFDVNSDNEPAFSSFAFYFITGPGPLQMRCRVRDTDPDGNFDQAVTVTNLTYS